MSALRTAILGLILALTTCLCTSQAAPPDAERPPAPQSPRRALAPVIPRQPAEDVLEPFEPKSPPSERDAARTEGMS
jgi:hypothetical protein